MFIVWWLQRRVCEEAMDAMGLAMAVDFIVLRLALLEWTYIGMITLRV
jgi:hypothetical protein